jgi:diaminohydroxyphosphoribosylaminopyrimidine deaminase/5-amino-6-(5-phosphoribosylamino)uracil reductase
MNFFDHEKEAPFLRRCFDLARLGAGAVSPNPMVGAVLVHEGRIIGEGYHHRHGGAHAEVEAVRSVSESDRVLLRESTLYVSLEPCCVFGRTPPCTNLILETGIPRVVVSNPDLSPGVNGEGFRQLRESGVTVAEVVLEAEGAPFSAIRNTFVGKKRPYVILKFARSADGFLGMPGRQVWLTGEVSKRLVHKWRSETDAIIVGAQTLRTDDPALTNRFFPGKSPVRLVMDARGELPPSLKVFDGAAPTWVFTENTGFYEGRQGISRVVTAPFGKAFLPFLLNYLAQAALTSLMVEGGAVLLEQFLSEGLWDEARVLTAPRKLGEGIQAPVMPGIPLAAYQIQNDRLEIYKQLEAIR